MPWDLEDEATRAMAEHFRHVERDRTPTRAEWNSEAERVPRPVWMDPITRAPVTPKDK